MRTSPSDVAPSGTRPDSEVPGQRDRTRADNHHVKDARPAIHATNRAGEKYFGLLRPKSSARPRATCSRRRPPDGIEGHDRQLQLSGQEIFIDEHSLRRRPAKSV